MKSKKYLQRGNGYRASSSWYRIRGNTQRNETHERVKKKKKRNWKLRIGNEEAKTKSKAAISDPKVTVSVFVQRNIRPYHFDEENQKGYGIVTTHEAVRKDSHGRTNRLTTPGYQK